MNEKKSSDHSSYPTGTVTFLFSDIEGSTLLLQRLGESRYEEILEEHRALLRSSFVRYEGHEVSTEGDSFFVVFRHAENAARAAVDAQVALDGHSWLGNESVCVRMGLHTGDVRLSGDTYIGLSVHQAARIASAAHGGQILISETTRSLLGNIADLEVTDLGQHRLKDLLHAVRIFQLTGRGLRKAFPPPRTLESSPHNLPAQTTKLIGRGSEIEEISRALESERIVTLTGVGGSGKTRLAVEVGKQMLTNGTFTDGVWLVELATVLEDALVPSAVATALSVSETGQTSTEDTLKTFLKDKRLLLILDNCEHLRSACAQISSSLIAAAPDLRILATSREALGLTGEGVRTVRSLTTPPRDEALEVEDLLSFEACRLFVDRALLVDPGLTITTQDARAIADICRRLDGIPLALELAAARVNVLTPDQIAERLGDRFRLLTGGSRVGLERQQTLKALIDWSYELLDDDECRLFALLSVFRGGFTLDAAEAVGRKAISSAVLDTLESLIRKSLVQRERSPRGLRFSMLETLRQYAADKLGQEDAQSAHDDHLAYYLQMSNELLPSLEKADEVAVFERVDAESENFRAALEWAMESDSGRHRAMELAASLWRYWWGRGYWSEGRRWLAQALDRAEGTDVGLQARALWAAGFLAHFQGDYVRSFDLLEQANSKAMEAEDERVLAYILFGFGHHYETRGRPEEADPFLRESLLLARRVGDSQVEGWCLHILGMCAARRGNYLGAEPLFSEALEKARANGDLWNEATALDNLGWLALKQGRLIEAKALLSESLQVYGTIMDAMGVAEVTRELGETALEMGDFVEGERLMSESLRMSLELGFSGRVARALLSLGLLNSRRGDKENADRFRQEGVALLEELGIDPITVLEEN